MDPLLDHGRQIIFYIFLMNKPSFDPGFTEKYRGGLSRIINPSGEFNVRRRGTTWRDIHPYLFMINASWPVFSALIFGGFVVANVDLCADLPEAWRGASSGCGHQHRAQPLSERLLLQRANLYHGGVRPNFTRRSSDQPGGVAASPVGIDGAGHWHGSAVRAIFAARGAPGLQQADGGGALSIRNQPAIPRGQPAQQQFDGSGSARDDEYRGILGPGTDAEISSI